MRGLLDDLATRWSRERAAHSRCRGPIGAKTDGRVKIIKLLLSGFDTLGPAPPSTPTQRPAVSSSRPKKDPPVSGLAKATDCAVTNVVAAGDVRQRLVAGIAARDGFAPLMRRQLGWGADHHRGSWNKI